MPMPRIIVLTAFGDYGDRILVRLSLRGVIPEAVLVHTPPAPAARSSARTARDMLGIRSPRRILASGLRRVVRALEPASAMDSPPGRHPWNGLAREVRYGGPLNSPPMLALLRDLRPDYLVLGDCGILGEETLAIPATATINAHPALLPWVRGMGVVERAIQRRVAVGVTVHLVNAGIDTGEIIRRELVPVHEADSIASIRRKAKVKCTDMLAEIAAAAALGEPPAAAAQHQRFPYSRWPSAEELARIEEEVRNGWAVRLYREWRDAIGSDLVPSGLELWREIATPPTGEANAAEGAHRAS